MKNVAVNKLDYTGVVTLSKYAGSKKVPFQQVTNSGRSKLFDFLADCLTGNFDTAKLIMPYMIRLLKEKEDGSYENVAGDIFIRTVPEKVINTHSNSCSVIYSFEVAYDRVAQAGDFSHIGLYSKDSDIENHSAICKVDVAAGSISSALLVDWQLNISNSTSAT